MISLMRNCDLTVKCNKRMKNSTVFIVAVLCAAAAACTSYREDMRYEPPSFPKEYTARIKPLNRETTMGNILRMYLCDSVLLVQGKNVDNDNVFHVFSINDGRYLSSFGYYGRGPNELASYYCAAQDIEGRTLHVLDTNGAYITIDIPRSIGNRRIEVISEGMASHHTTTNSIFSLPKGRLLHCEGFGCRFFSTDMQYRDTVRLHDAFPYISPEFEADTIIRKSYFSMFTMHDVKPDRTRLVCTSANGMLMEIFDIGRDSIRPVVTRRFFEPKMKNQIAPQPDCISGSCSLKTSDKYIYLVYSDGLALDMDNTEYILGIFDWSGQEVARYRLDSNIGPFVVMPDDSRIYCWAQNEEGEEYLGYFDLEH